MAGSKISPKMKKGIAVCEEILHIKYEGSSFEDARKFLDENLPKIQGKDIRDYREPSEKMLRGIAYIMSVTGKTFEGKTMKEASEFIAEYMPKVQDKKGRKK